MQTLTIFTLHLSVQPERRKDLLDIFTALLEPTRVQPGCLGCHLHTDYNDQNSLTLIGEWSSQAELECYLDSSRRNFLVAAVDLATETPQVQIDTVVRRTGLALVAELDKATKS